MELFSEKLGCPKRPLEPEALEALRHYSWPGNVRELMNVIESAYTFGRGESIGVAELPPAMVCEATLAADSPSPLSLVSTFAEAERNLIARALEATGGNKLRTARLLGISRKKLYAKIAKYRL